LPARTAWEITHHLDDMTAPQQLVIGVLALQGAFLEHINLLKKASQRYPSHHFTFTEVRTTEQLEQCDALIIPGGESTTLSLVAERSKLLEPLRDFVK